MAIELSDAGMYNHAASSALSGLLDCLSIHDRQALAPSIDTLVRFVQTTEHAAVVEQERQGEGIEHHPCLCFTCRANVTYGTDAIMSSLHPDYCVHLTPEYWADQGYQRNWGDAAVMAWPELEVLCKQDDGKIEYLILNGSLRGPVRISAHVVSGAMY